MALYGEENGFYEENRETVYHAGNGFYNPYIEPLWKKEKRTLQNTANGIGLAALAYIAISGIGNTIYTLFMQLFYPVASIRNFPFLYECTEWLFSIIIYVLSIIIPFGIFALCIKIPFKVAFPFNKAKNDLSVSGIIIGLGISVLASYVVGYLQFGLEYIGIRITMPEYEVPQSVVGIICYIVAVVLAPAFIEEIAFRGIVMQSLRRFGDIFAIVASALLFGIFHLNLVQMPYAFIMGLCMGYFVMRTGSLWVGIITHLINNAAAVAFEFAYPYMSVEAYYLANLIYNLVFSLLAIIAFVYVIIKYKDIFRFEPSKNVLSPGKRTLYFATAPGILLAMAAAVAMTLPYIYLI